jgi:hypothetical protein
VATGRTGRFSSQSHVDCPAWCREDEDDAHLSADRAVGPFLARLYGAIPAPKVDLIRDARQEDNERPLTVTESEELGVALLELAAAARAEHNM